MGSLQDVVLLGVDQRHLLLRKPAPQQEYEALPAGAQGGDGRVCEALPALLAVGGGVVCPHRQHRIEQEHSLMGPLQRIHWIRASSAPRCHPVIYSSCLC